MIEDRVRHSRQRVAGCAERYLERGDDHDARRRLLGAIREHGEQVRSSNRLAYRVLLAELEDSAVLKRYAARIAKVPYG